ncbi:uncharacterized protein LOC130756252 isoform X2 [Actinidia eriantha]|uniref:uncharacterized protein LOC130756252 isoform X2 n=1 Tax=Actinidia eriantha TaxID=165200 RepID=UPI002587E4EA|nr:uncharacterized protein LOC130756252 isoform X2 [Actinidia eriantha]
MASTPPVDLFQPSSNSSVLSLHAHQPSQTIPPSLNTFDMPPHQPGATLDQKYQEDVIPKNERWATFDLPHFVAPNLGVDDSIPAVVPPTGGGALGKFDSLLLSSATLQWPVFDDSNAHGPSSMPNLWHEVLNNVPVSDNAMSAQYMGGIYSSFMSSLQAALPSGQIPNSYLDGVTRPWFPQNTVTPYVPARQGALGFMGASTKHSYADLGNIAL